MLFNPRVSTEEGPWSPSSPKARRSVSGWSLHSAKTLPVGRCGSGRYGFHIRRHGPVSGVDGLLRLVRTKTGVRTIPIQKSNKTTSHTTDLELEPNPPAIVRETPMCCSCSGARPSTTTQMKIFDTPWQPTALSTPQRARCGSLQHHRRAPVLRPLSRKVLMLTGQGGEDAVASALLAKALLDISPHSPGKDKHVAWLLTERCRRYRLPTPSSCCAIKRSLRSCGFRSGDTSCPESLHAFTSPCCGNSAQYSSRTHDVTVPVLQVVGIIVWTLARRLDHR